MLSVIDIIRALTVLIEDQFPAYTVMDNDVEEGFPRPCYFIDVDSVTGDNVTNRYVRETSTLSVYFFAEDTYKGFLDLLQMKDSLLDILNRPLPLTRQNETETVAHILFDDVSVDVSKADKALQCQMTSVLIQERADESTDYTIENLSINIE